MGEEANLTEDAPSVNSRNSGCAWKKGTEFISLSCCTIYPSAQDLNIKESDDEVKPMMATGHDTMGSSSDNYENQTLTGPSVFQNKDNLVDFVLVWDENSPDSCSGDACQTREKFEGHLEKEGLKLERVQNKSLHFVMIHAPFEVLGRYADILKLRMPIKACDVPEDLKGLSFDITLEVKSVVRRLMQFVHVDLTVFPSQKKRLTAEFSRAKEYLFDTKSQNFFTAAVRTTVVDFILERMEVSEDRKTTCFGINRLISDGVYSAAYPLHDGDYRQEGCLRYSLHKEWASVRKWIKLQPIDYIKEYFGIKFGLYFAWLGFYTYMLIPAAVVGLICFFYGLATMYSNTYSEDICNHHLNIVMCPLSYTCPLCDTCPFWNLTDACDYARATYLFDNPFTVYFALFMSFWGTLFLELWKRYSANLTHHWGLSGFDLQAEHPRPEYLAKLHHVKPTLNVVTRTMEPHAPFWKVRVPCTIFSFSVVLLLITVAVGAVCGVVLYRMASYGPRSMFQGQNSDFLIPTTAAVINLVFIMLLNYPYDWLAVKLTEMELLRTQTEFDDSLTLKIYLFQFVNYYTSIFYIAFLKGKFVGSPAKYNLIFGWRQEECNPGGCLMELCIQLAVIMVGKQAFNAVLEMVIPLLYKWRKTSKIKTELQVEDKENGKIKNQWMEDYKLLDWGQRGLFPEYLEMVLQYGFVTIFVAAFPLAPFFALLNNVLEMRLDAKKFLRFYRRPVPRRVKNIGVWYRILDIIGRLSAVTNAFIIAFSSTFIPRIVYMMKISPDHTDVGFLSHSLAYFNTSDFKYPRTNVCYVEVCRYPEYRNPPWHERPYKRPVIYWHILAARLAFVVVFQSAVGLVRMAVQWLIPDTSRRLRDEILKEAFVTHEIVIAEERKQARESISVGGTSGISLKGERNAIDSNAMLSRKRKPVITKKLPFPIFRTFESFLDQKKEIFMESKQHELNVYLLLENTVATTFLGHKNPQCFSKFPGPDHQNCYI